MKSDPRLFAFKLAQKKAPGDARKDQKWKARAGVSLAGCTPSGFKGLVLRYGTDNGYAC